MWTHSIVEAMRNNDVCGTIAANTEFGAITSAVKREVSERENEMIGRDSTEMARRTCR